jgi:hypothetical protein
LAAAPEQPSFQAGLMALPRYVPERRDALTASPSAQDRARLNELAALASLEPRLIAGPTLASRRSGSGALPSLTTNATPRAAAEPPTGPRLAAIDPAPGLGSGSLIDGAAGRFGWGNGWVSAPAYDEEHPEELSYRPFPIGPLLTTSATEPLLADLVHHDVARTVDMIDQPGTALPLRFRPGEQLAQLMWAQQFRGDPIGLSKLLAAQSAEPAPSTLHERQVRTTGR